MYYALKIVDFISEEARQGKAGIPALWTSVRLLEFPSLEDMGHDVPFASFDITAGQALGKIRYRKINGDQVEGDFIGFMR